MQNTKFTLFQPTTIHSSEIAKLWIDSITKLCVCDHNNDPIILTAWTENKTTAFLSEAFNNPYLHWVAAQHQDGPIVGIGMVRNDGIICAVYIHPDFTSIKIGTSILAHLENQACNNGIDTIRLESTGTAHAFYHHNGYVDSAPPLQHFGVTAYPMEKHIKQPDWR